MPVRDAGSFRITAKSADRTRSASETVEVEIGCSPEQRSVTVEREISSCGVGLVVARVDRTP